MLPLLPHTYTPLPSILHLSLHLSLTPEHQTTLYSHLTRLPPTSTGLRLGHLTSLLPGATALPPPTLAAMLEMVEALVEGVPEVEAATDTWRQEELPDSAIASSGGEESEEVREEGFQPYLEVMLEANVREEVMEHLERLVVTTAAATRHLLASQLVLPFLHTELLKEGIEEVAKCEPVLEVLCSLAHQQPTAMALVRNQAVWRRVKVLASAPGPLSRPCQQVIKTIVLSSGKFNKIKLSEAEAMALQDDESDVINFQQRDQNAQYWIFKQLYQVRPRSWCSGHSLATVLRSGAPVTMVQSVEKPRV